MYIYVYKFISILIYECIYLLKFTTRAVYNETVDTLEALNGTLRKAKKTNVISFKKQMMLKGPDDKELITLAADHAK